MKIKLKATALALIICLISQILSIYAIAKTHELNITDAQTAKKKPKIVAEIEQNRDENEKHFLLSDGRKMAVSYPNAVHYKDEDGVWQDIDNTLKSANDDEYTTTDSDIEATLFKKMKKHKTVELSIDGYEISWGFADANNADAQVQENPERKGNNKFLILDDITSTTLYEDVFDNVDAEYIINPEGVKENIILKDDDAQNKFEIVYKYKDLTPTQKDEKTILLKNDKNKTIYTIEAPVMFDSNGQTSEGVTLNITKSNSSQMTVELTVDAEWLEDSEREYPVVIDPEIEVNSKTIGSYELGEANDADYEQSSSSGYVGTHSYLGYPVEIMTVVRMTNMPSIGTGGYVTNAKLTLSAVTFSGPVGVYAIEGENAVDDISTLTWDDLAYITDGYADDITNTTTPEMFFSLVNWDITASAQRNYRKDLTFVLKSESGGLSQFMTQTPFVAPYVTVTYVDKTGISDKNSYHTQSMGRAGTAYINDLTGRLELSRTDMGYESEKMSASIGMNFVAGGADFLYHGLSTAYDTFDYGWRNTYFETITTPESGAYYKAWFRADGTRVYFSATGENVDEDTVSYPAMHGYDYKFIVNTASGVDDYIEATDGTRYYFDTYGRLIKIQNGDDATDKITISYPTLSGNNYQSISQITDGAGKVYAFSYDSNQNLTSVSYKGTGTTVLDSVSYSYNSNNKLTEVNYHGEKSRYAYTSTGLISSITAPDGYKLTYEYYDDTAGASYNPRVKKVTEYGSDNTKGNHMTVTYSNRYTTYEDANGNQENLLFDEFGNVQTTTDGKGNTLFSKSDSNGNFLGSTDVSVPLTNLILDSSFEQCTYPSATATEIQSDYWTFSSGASIYTQSTDDEIDYSYNGSKSIKFVSDNFNNVQKATQVVTGNLPSGRTYTLSAYFNGSAITEEQDIKKGANVELQINYKDGTKSDLVDGLAISGHLDEWTRVKASVTASESKEIKSITISVKMVNAENTLYVDAVQLEWFRNANAYTMVNNGNFYKSGTEWSLSGGASIEQKNMLSHLDDNVLVLTNNENSQASSANTVVSVNPLEPETYTLSMWLKTQGCQTGKRPNGLSGLSLHVIGLQSNTIPNNNEVADADLFETLPINVSLKNQWVPYSVCFTSKSGYDKIALQIQLEGLEGNVQIDGLSITDGAYYQENDGSENDSYEPEEAEIEYPADGIYTMQGIIDDFNDETGGSVGANTAFEGKSLRVSNGLTKTSDLTEMIDDTVRGIRFWYKSNSATTVTMTDGETNYTATLPIASNGTWKTIYRKDSSLFSDFTSISFQSAGITFIDSLQTITFNIPQDEGYSYLSTINSFDSFTGISNVACITNGSHQNGTAAAENSWAVSCNSNVYTTTDNYAYGGIDFKGTELDGTGFRFWYKSTKQATMSLRADAIYSEETDYNITLSAAPDGKWKTIKYSSIKNDGKDVADFKYIHIKTTDNDVFYLDELHTVELEDITTTTESKQIADVTAEENNGYPVLDQYVYHNTINTFDNYTGNANVNYLIAGTEASSNAYTGKSWGINEAEDVYSYTDSNGSTQYITGISFPGSTLQGDSTAAGVRFWYKSTCKAEVSFRIYPTGYYQGPDKVFTLPSAPNGDWFTVMREDFIALGGYSCMHVELLSDGVFYLDELHSIKQAENVFTVTETLEKTRHGETQISASGSYTSGTISKEVYIDQLGNFTKTLTNLNFGDTISTEDANDIATEYTYNALRQMTKMAKDGVEVQYAYSNGALQTVTLGDMVYTFTYNKFGDITAVKLNGTSLISYTYKSNVNRIVSEITYANGQSLQYVYNTDNALESIKSGNVVLYSYTYDENGNVITKTDETLDIITDYTSELYTVTYEVGSTTPLNYHFTTETEYDNESAYKLVEKEGNLSNFKTITYSTGGTAENGAQDEVLPIDVVDYNGVKRTTTKDLFGRKKTIVTNSTMPMISGIVDGVQQESDKPVLLQSFGYTSTPAGNTSDFISQIYTSYGTDGNLNNNIVLNYKYDKNGNITSIEQDGSAYIHYRYNNDGSLSDEYRDGKHIHYVYDDNGNILSKETVSSTYNPATKQWTDADETPTVVIYEYNNSSWGDQLTSYNGTAITYDALGNPTSYRGANLTWSQGRQLASYNKGDTSVSYVYDDSGLRAQKTVNGQKYTYTWRDGLLTHQEWNNANNDYIHFYYDEYDIVGFSYGTDEFTYIKNLQGDVIGIVNDNGQLVASYSYDAWGKLLGSSGAMADINPIRYRGYYYDDETGLYYLQSRYYDPTTGRFINADEVYYLGASGTVLGYNLFAYCENNSTNFVDPKGTDAIFLYDSKGAPLYAFGVTLMRFGHVALLIEYKDSWYYFSSSGSKGYDFKYLGSMDTNRLTIKRINKKIGIFASNEVKRGKLIYKGTYTDYFYIKGNFNKSYKRALKIIISGKKYSALKYNCLHVACETLLEGKFKGDNADLIREMYSLLAGLTVPDLAYTQLKNFYDRMGMFASHSLNVKQRMAV